MEGRLCGDNLLGVDWNTLLWNKLVVKKMLDMHYACGAYAWACDAWDYACYVEM